MSRKILVTAALPYANGHIHIGHLVEYLQTDIWVRFQKLRGHRCLFFCADDTHGTAIMMRARKEGRSETELIEEMSRSHQQDFADFGIEFDNYGSTDSEENKILGERIWKSLREAGLVETRDVTQLYDPQEGTFLADRYVKGNCPKCGADDQYGDNCEVCGATYSPSELKNPVSVYSGTTPEVRTAPHAFVNIEQLHDFLDDWTQSGKHLQSEVANYLKGHFLGEPLRDWDVSRPAPYFGFEIPDMPGHYWYVWFDAPIGYIASTWQWCKRNNEELESWWADDSTEIHHFIGKDITYFHTLFWPAMLKTAEMNLPTKVHIHGFLKVNGEKMSKRRGTFILARTYLNNLDPAWLRYYFATKLNSRLDDLDLNVQEFVDKVNADLVGKVVNIASRCAKFIGGQTLCETYPDDGGLFAKAAAAGEQIAAHYENCDYSPAMREIMQLAEAANKYVEDNQPWKLRKDPEKAEELREVCTVALNLFRQVVIYLSPVLPRLTEQAGELLSDPLDSWDKSQTPLTNSLVNKFSHMMKRVELEQVEKMIEESREDQAADAAPNPAAQWDDSAQPLADEPLADECTIDDFVKVDLRVARIVEANPVEGADKLLQLTLSLGGDHTRNVFAGIKAAYNPEDLIGRLVVCVANLKPRKMRFGLSEGMVCASGPGGKEVFLLQPDEGAKPGQRVH
ncbi:MAG: methionine--tRNA ligase [Rubinisphaera brasiliensis]|uniref:methionine--tRNA ligase n=1 Tax=Rubinisphaera brasiliensis TaxID=119 RepID=UPI00391C754C